MADFVRAQGEAIPPSMRSRWVDLEDGTHALVVAAVPVGPVEVGTAPIVLLVDEITGASVSIPVVHHEIHEGETFEVSFKTPDGTPLADNAALSFLLQTGARFCHITWGGATGGDGELLFYEGTTFSAVGAALVIHNMKYTSSNVSTVTATLDPTVTNIGAQKHNCFWPGGTGGNAQGGTLRSGSERILQPNTAYLLRLINRAGNQQPASLGAQWYEEETN